MRFRQACLSVTLTSVGANLLGRSDVLVAVAEGALNTRVITKLVSCNQGFSESPSA